MTHFSLFRLLPCILIAACPALFIHCGSSADSTETGNPGVAEQKLHIFTRDTGVEVVGDIGAVDAGANVSVVNRRSGDHADAIAKADGSFLIVVPGSLQDEYAVTVSSGSATQTVGLSATANQTGDTGADLMNASCALLDDEIDKRVAIDLSASDATCESDVDCFYVDRQTACSSQCGGRFLSATGAEAAGAAFELDVKPLCDESSRRCSPETFTSCAAPPDPFEAECYDRACRSANIDGLTCNDLASKADSRANDLLDRAPRACTTDADCALVSYAVSCVAGCGNRFKSVNANEVESAKASVQRVEDYFCSRFANKPCPAPLDLPCARPPNQGPQATCVAGQCEIASAAGQ